MSALNNYECEGQMTIFDFLGRDSWCGKTSEAQSRREPQEARTSESYLKKQPKSQTKMPLFLDLRTANGQVAAASWVTGGALPGEYTMRSFGEYPNEERESRLSQITEACAPQKYYLSARACQGILNRAKRKNKKLPEILEKVLIAQASA